MAKCWLSMASVAEFQFPPHSTKQMATSRRGTNFRLKLRAALSHLASKGGLTALDRSAKILESLSPALEQR
jgi:hypothetical protein